ncbi:hypothetical protein OY671_000406 [Metschnikowia pulcherrima]|nr:hypothetical protein OY671_000406 [Metschnikowia pulcherrima]
MAGNWKMNSDHHQATHTVQKLAWTSKDAKHDYAAVEVAVSPPFTDLRSVQTLVDADKLELKYGAQDVSAHAEGAYTGEISASMSAKLGVSYVAIGHSERRQYHGETDASVNEKIVAAVGQGIAPISCVGEGSDVRKAGEQIAYTLAQVEGALAGIPAPQLATLVIAYEPVWAIGTGEVATPEDAQEVCGAIRGALGDLYDADLANATRVSYGGSVKSSNVAAIMAQPDVDGALVGGASLDPEEFAKIARYHLKDVLVDVSRIILQISSVSTSAFLTSLVLMHKGKGGGLSDMFGGGISSSVGSSGVAERNLNRITVAFALVWAVVIVLSGLLQKVESPQSAGGKPRTVARSGQERHVAGGNAIRGSRVGAGPLGESERGEIAPRFWVSYWCANGHETRPSFSSEAGIEAPETWDCPRCGFPAGQDQEHPPTPSRNEPYKTHLAYVKERRSDEDGVAILDEALAASRARRGR